MDEVKLTNKYGAPDPVVKAVENDSYNRGDSVISITGLSKPPRIVTLEEHYKDQIEEDVSDRIFSLLGQLMHLLLERASYRGQLKLEDLTALIPAAVDDATGLIDIQKLVRLAFKKANPHHLVEERLFAKILDWRVSGQTDSMLIDIEGGNIDDYKLISAWQVKDGLKEEYEAQLNGYVLLAFLNGIVIKTARIVAILRDWTSGKAEREADFPQRQIIIQDVPIWPIEISKGYFEERVRVHQKARKRLPLCTAEERWARPTLWAVMHPDRKKALKLHDNQADAEAHALKVKDAYVQVRPGKNVRCEGNGGRPYCSVAQFCTQLKKMKAREEKEKK